MGENNLLANLNSIIKQQNQDSDIRPVQYALPEQSVDAPVCGFTGCGFYMRIFYYINHYF